MKKLKKLSKSKKPVVIFIYGPIAVGKLTVAKTLQKKLGYQLTHNHEINDLVDGLFDHDTDLNSALKESLRHSLLETIVKGKISFITTHAYAHDYVSSTGLSDPKDLETLEKRLTELGAKFCGVHLKANKETLLDRVDKVSRKKFGKLKDKKIMRKLLLTKDFQTSPNLKNNLVIDNSKLAPNKVADMIIKHFKIHDN